MIKKEIGYSCDSLGGDDTTEDDKVHAGFAQFKKAFEAHWKSGSQGNDLSHHLLQFYSVECGLKSMYIHKKDKSHRMNSNDMPDHGHRLEYWINELTLPAYSIQLPPQFKLKSTINIESPREIYRVHEAWRYGVAIDPEDERAILEWMSNASEFIRKRLLEA